MEKGDGSYYTAETHSPRSPILILFRRDKEGKRDEESFSSSSHKLREREEKDSFNPEIALEALRRKKKN